MIFVGDLHCEKKRKVTYGNPEIWNNKPLELLGQIIKNENPKDLVLLGDVFDTANPDSLSYGKFIATVINVPNVWIVEGNHDRPKVEREYAFQKLSELPNVHLVEKNTLRFMEPGVYGIGWCDTQDDFERLLLEALEIMQPEEILCLHCNWADWGNQMDNTMPSHLYKQFKEKNILCLAGHEHTFHQEDSLIHLGAIMPMTIGELGAKYYYSVSKGLIAIDHRVGTDSESCDVLLLREEPEDIVDTKTYYVKTGKEVSIEDIQMETKDLKIDILQDFTKAALTAGFSLDLLQEFINVKKD